VDSGIGGIFKLLGDERAGNFLCEGFGTGDGALHAFSGGGELQLCSMESEEGPALEAHTFRQGENEFVSFGGSDKSEGDPGVARGRFDDGGLRSDFSVFFPCFNHSCADPVLDASERIKELTFDGDRGGKACGDATQFYERGPANGP